MVELTKWPSTDKTMCNYYEIELAPVNSIFYIVGEIGWIIKKQICYYIYVKLAYKNEFAVVALCYELEIIYKNKACKAEEFCKSVMECEIIYEEV